MRANTDTLGNKDPTQSLSMGPSMGRWNPESMGFAGQAVTIQVPKGEVEGAAEQVATWSETACSEDL